MIFQLSLDSEVLTVGWKIANITALFENVGQCHLLITNQLV